MRQEKPRVYGVCGSAGWSGIAAKTTQSGTQAFVPGAEHEETCGSVLTSV